MGTFKNRLTLRHLRLLDTLGQKLSISRTAESLHTSPSSISRGLSEIEDLVGATLFDRTTRSLTPTALGRNLLRHANHILTQFDRAESDFHSLMSGKGDRLEVGLMGGISPPMLARAVQLMERRSPNVAIRFRSNYASRLIGELVEGHCDVIITHFDIERIDNQDLAVDTLYSERIAVVTGLDHPLAAKERVTWEELSDQRWTLVPNETSTRRIVEHKLLTSGAQRVQVIAETIEIHFVIELIRSAGMVTGLPHQLGLWVQDELKAGRCLPIEDNLSPWPVCAARLAHQEPTEAGRLFVDCLKEACRDLQLAARP